MRLVFFSTESLEKGTAALALRGAHASRSCRAAQSAGEFHHAECASLGGATDGGQSHCGEHDRVAAVQQWQEVCVCVTLAGCWFNANLSGIPHYYCPQRQHRLERAGCQIVGVGQRGDALRGSATQARVGAAGGACESRMSRGVGGAADVRSLNSVRCICFVKEIINVNLSLNDVCKAVRKTHNHACVCVCVCVSNRTCLIVQGFRCDVTVFFFEFIVVQSKTVDTQKMCGVRHDLFEWRQVYQTM